MARKLSIAKFVIVIASMAAVLSDVAFSNGDDGQAKEALRSINKIERMQDMKRDNQRRNGHLSKQAKASLRYLELHAEEFGLTVPVIQLRVEREFTDSLDMTHIRFQQIEEGVPVWAHTLTVHLREDGEVYGVDGRVLPSLSGINTKPRLSPADAGVAARAKMPGGADAWSTVDALLYIYPLANGQAALTYLVTIVKGLERQFVFVDALNGGIIAEIEGTPTR